MSLVIGPSVQISGEESPVSPRHTSRRSPTEPVVKEKSKWSYYHKPITLLVFGAIVFLVGILYTIFYFTKYLDVPYALGPVFLSIGLIFLVTGLVWLPIITESIRRKGLLRKMAAHSLTLA